MWITDLFKRKSKSEVVGLKPKMSPYGPLVTIDKTVCPACHGNIDIGIAKLVNHSGKTQEGDVGVCHSCGAVLEFKEGGLKLISDSTWEHIPGGMKAAIMRLSQQSGAGKPLTPRSQKSEIDELFK